MGYIKLSTAFCACLIALVAVDNKAYTKSSYYDRHPGIQLQGHMIKKMTTSDLWNCVFECGKTPGCLSINSNNVGNVIHCELNKSNRYGRQANLIKTSLDWEYLEMVFNPNWSDVCFQKGQTCLELHCAIKEKSLGVIDGWYRGKSAAYKFVNERVTAQLARQRCQKMLAGADLVSFVDKEEEEIFDQYLRGIDQTGQFWIGLNDFAKDGTFVWSDGTKSNYRNWFRTEPTNNAGEHCVWKTLEKGWLWHDDLCVRNYPFACKVLCT